MLALAYFSICLFNRTKNSGHILATSINHLAGYQTGYFWGYKFGCITGILVYSVAIAGMLFKLYNHWNNRSIL